MNVSEDEYTLVQLANGVYSVRSALYGETYHPVVGPEVEARALYLDQLHLVDRLQTRPGEAMVLWDVGLGVASNPLTVLAATRDVPTPIRLVSFDRTVAPLRFALRQVEALPFLKGFEAPLRQLAETGSASFRNGCQPVQWELHLADFPALLASAPAETLPKPDAILYDAHSPARNPEMWTLPLLTRIHQLLDPARPCALATHTRSTLLRVSLLLAGFFVGRGRATGEKEETTLAANRLELIERPLDSAWLRRAGNSTSAEPLVQPVYRQMPLTSGTREQLQAHPQFQPAHGPRQDEPGLGTA